MIAKIKKTLLEATVIVSVELAIFAVFCVAYYVGYEL